MTVIFEAGMLPDSQKETLCRSLLDEFGAKISSERDAELIHGCLLPWANHKDQKANPTASLNWEKLTYKCLGCGAGGGLLWFIASCRGTSSKEARSWLDKSQGLGNELMGLGDLLRFFDALYESTKSRAKAPIPRYDERMLKPWDLRHPYMFDPISEGGRGISMETLDRFHIGYAPEYQVRAGDDANGNPIFKSSERIVIPHFWNDDLVGWQTRKLGDDGTAKYLSSPDFPKDQTIYNFDYMAEVAVVVESPLSVLAHAHHMQIEATFGASVTDAQLRVLQKHPNVVIWMDNDDAGWKSTERMSEALAAYSNVLIVDNPYDADPADLPADVAQELVAGALPYGVWTRPKEVTTWDSKSSVPETV